MTEWLTQATLSSPLDTMCLYTYRAKSAEEKEKHLDHCKYLVLKRNVALKKVLPGVKKGIAYDVVFNTHGMFIRTECGQLLTLKVSLLLITSCALVTK